MDPAGYIPPEEVVTQARQWIDRVDAGRGLSNGWRLQVIQKRYRRRDVASDTGTGLDCDTTGCDGMPLRIRRFVPGCPWALVDQAIRYLICKAPYEGLIYNGLVIPGKYRPTLTMWQRDEQSTVDEQNPRNGTYTLIQDLVQDGCEDSESVVTEETCTYEETTVFTWDSATPGSLPGCGDPSCGGSPCQGHTYALRTQRKDDGTFDWQLVDRRAKTQHTGPVKVSCGPCEPEVTTESWRNLYGSEDAFLDSCKVPVDVPACSEEPGVRVQRKVDRNPDCTYNVEVVTTVSPELSDSWTDGTACRARESYEARGLRSLPPEVAPEVGETVRVQLRREEDCTYTYQREVTRAPDPYGYSWTDGNACRPRTVEVLRAQRSMPEVPRAKAGQTVDASISRNDDCTWDSQVTIREPAQEDVISWTQGTSCQPETVTSYQNSATVPDVPRAKAGQTVRASIRRNDDCTYDGQVTVSEGLSAETVEWDEGSLCRPVHSTSFFNSPTVPSVPRPGKGERVSASIRRNGDCTYDATVQVAKPHEGSAVETWTDGPSCQRTHHSLYVSSKDKPVVPEPGTGQTVRADLNFNDSDCTWSGRVAVTDAPTSDHMHWTEGSSCRKVESHHLVNQASYSVPEPQTGQMVSANVSRNGDCTYDVTYRIQNPYEGDVVQWTDGSSCRRQDHTLWIDQKTRPTVKGASDGETVSASLRFDPSSCTWSGEQVVRAKPSESNGSWTDGTSCQKTTHTVYSNVTAIPRIPSAARGENVSANFSFNDSDCTWSGRVSVTGAPRADHMHWTEGSSCRRIESHHLVNQTSYSVPEPQTGQTVSASVSRNGDCTYDVTYRVQNPYEGDVVEWTDGSSCRSQDHTLWIDRKSKPSIRQASDGETVSASLRFDPSSCTWSGEQVVRARPARETREWVDGTSCRPVTHRAYFNVDDIPDIRTPSDGETVSANFSFNDSDCTWSGTVAERAAPEPGDESWTEGSTCEQVDVKVFRNQKDYNIPVPSDGQIVSGSVTKNDDCLYDYRYTVTTAEQTSSIKTWESTEKSPSGRKVTYEHGVMAFKNYDEIPDAPSGHSNVMVSFKINKFCKYDGTISWTDLKSWSDPGNDEGGIRTGYMSDTSIIMMSGGRPASLRYRYKTIAFLGSGNEGTEAAYIMNGYVPIGGSGSVRVYRSTEPDGLATFETIST